MPRPKHLAAVLLSAVLAVLLTACSTVPTALAPVSDILPESSADYPPDAVFAVRAAVAHVKGQTVRGASFAPEAHHSLLEHGFDYPGFETGPHRLVRYEARDDGGKGRRVAGVVGLTGPHGRRARLAYDLRYNLQDGVLRVDTARVTAVYPREPSIHVFLVHKNELPEPAAAWEDTYLAARRLDAMPEGGLRDERLLDTHSLMLFVMDRTAPGSDVRLSLDIPELRRILPVVDLTHEDYRDYHGWRVAVVSIAPEMRAAL